MSLRKMNLPADFVPVAEITPEIMQYPDNPEWSIQADEEESMGESFDKLSKIWPLIRFIQFLSPGLRDILHGFLWEEEGQLGGYSQFSRRGTTKTWEISAVGVHPDFRRRGIAKKLVQASMDTIRAREGEKVLLDMIDGNFPAFELYSKLGFEKFSGSIYFHSMPEPIIEKPMLPEGYAQEYSSMFDWEPRFALEDRITPAPVKKYEPIEEARFKKPLLTRFLLPLLLKAENNKVFDFLIRTADGEVVARGIYTTKTKESGQNTISAVLDPAHSDLADFLVNYMLYQIDLKSPGHRIEFQVPWWMESLAGAAEKAGFTRRFEFIRMGAII